MVNERRGCGPERQAMVVGSPIKGQACCVGPQAVIGRDLVWNSQLRRDRGMLPLFNTSAGTPTSRQAA